MIQKFVIRLLFAAAAIMLLDQLGFWVWLVAHPFWNFQGALIGTAIGTGILLIRKVAFKRLEANKALNLGLILISVAIAAAIAIFGKTGFASSFGEDRSAGMLWYYGYLALTTTVFVMFYEFLGWFSTENSTDSDSTS